MIKLNITKKMTGKLEGISSLNTDPFSNPFCMKMSAQPKSVCSQCYSQAMLKAYRKSCQKPWAENGENLSKRLLTPQELPVIKKSIFRFSAHGEIINKTMYLNYLAIARNNPDTSFTVWTKRKDIIAKIGKAGVNNIILIYSSPILNDLNPVVPTNFDKVFTVYTPDVAGPNDVKINCGKKKCIECMSCYSQNDTTHINEIVKSKQHIWNHMQEVK